jgi:hypothetical protein
MNIVAVVRTAKLYGVPIVPSTVNAKTGANQPTIHQLADVLDDIEALDRTTINAWEDKEFVHAVKATGRKKFLMTALWTEACLSFRRSTPSERDTRSTRSWMPSAAHPSRHTEQRSTASPKPARSRRAGSTSSASFSAIGHARRLCRSSR